jgi:hypothetical protein
MVRVTFTKNIQRHVACPTVEAPPGSLRQVLEAVFQENENVRGYVLDDRGGVRRHMVVFVNGRQIQDRAALSDPVPDQAEVYVMQALSGG